MIQYPIKYPIRSLGDLERYEGRNWDHIFSGPTGNKVLEGFIDGVINEYRDLLPTEASRILMREFFLYGLLEATDHEFKDTISYFDSSAYVMQRWERTGRFTTNNGVLGVGDFDGNVFIRAGDSYHGLTVLDNECDAKGVEGTLLGNGYRRGGDFIPHSNADIYVDNNMEALFQALSSFSARVRTLRGEAVGGLIIKDGTPDPPAPYNRRSPDLPRIELEELMFIPGNRNFPITISADRHRTVSMV